MLPSAINLDPVSWAEQTFGGVDLGDVRRTHRLVAFAAQALRRPAASLPAQCQSLAHLKAIYRLLAEADVTHPKLIAPHCTHTRGLAGAQDTVLLIQDTTTLDYTPHPTTSGLGPIGDGKLTAQGYLLHTTLAVSPRPRQVLGIAHQAPFVRVPAPPSETRTQRRKRPRESQVWERAAMAVGSPPVGSRWVHVGDAGSDVVDFLATCHAQQVDYLVRVAQDRCMTWPDATPDHLIQAARTLPALATRSVTVAADGPQPARTTTVAVGTTPLTLLPPRTSGWQQALPVWCIRVWEVDPPVDIAEPLEWILVTSVPTATIAECWERVDWYSCRWVVEEYHQCLKTGCAIEQRQLQTYDGLVRLLGILAVVAVQLLQLRDVVRLEPEQPATTVLPAAVVDIVAALAGVASASVTVGMAWRIIAQQGGYLGRKRDGPPGWKTLWRGWLHIQTLLEGVQLATRLPPATYG